MKLYTFEKIAGIQPSKDYLRNPKYQFEKIAAGGRPSQSARSTASKPLPDTSALDLNSGKPSTPITAPLPQNKRAPAPNSTQPPNKPTPMNLLPDNSIPNAQPAVDLSTGDGRDAAAAVSNALEMTPQQEQANNQYFGRGPYFNKMWGLGVDPHYYEAGPNGTATGTAFLPNGKRLPPAEVNRRWGVNGQLNDVSPEQANANGIAYNERTGVPWRDPSRAGLPFNPTESAYQRSLNILNQAKSPEDYNRMAGVLNSNPMARSLYSEGQKAGYDDMRRNGVQFPLMRVPTTTEMLAFAPNPTNNIEIADSRIRNQRILGQQRMDARADALIAQQAEERARQQQALQQWGRLSPGQLRSMGFDNPQDWYSKTPEQRREWFKQRQDKRLADKRQAIQEQFDNNWENTSRGRYNGMEDFQRYRKDTLNRYEDKWRKLGKSDAEINDFIRRTYGYKLDNMGIDRGENRPSTVPINPRTGQPLSASTGMQSILEKQPTPASVPQAVLNPQTGKPLSESQGMHSILDKAKQLGPKGARGMAKIKKRVAPIVGKITGAIKDKAQQLGGLFFRGDDPDVESTGEPSSKS